MTTLKILQLLSAVHLVIGSIGNSLVIPYRGKILVKEIVILNLFLGMFLSMFTHANINFFQI